MIFQKNVAPDFDELAVAWTVIQYCGQGENHPFVFPMTMSVGTSDSYGNYTPQLPAQNGQLFQMALTPSGDSLKAAGSGTSSNEVQVMNSAIMSNINTEFSLLGIASADIVMTGGGPGANSTPFQFNLENIMMA